MFPASFEFPDSISTIQRYKMLGNSLNVYIISQLLDYMVKEPERGSEAERAQEETQTEQGRELEGDESVRE